MKCRACTIINLESSQHNTPSCSNSNNYDCYCHNNDNIITIIMIIIVIVTADFKNSILCQFQRCTVHPLTVVANCSRSTVRIVLIPVAGIESCAILLWNYRVHYRNDEKTFSRAVKDCNYSWLSFLL